jgi:peptide/nickel transport system ATP-binding protein
MAEPLLSVRGLRVEIATRRRSLVAVDGVSFDIAAGEVLGLVGESGAGKSITGTAILGLLDPPARLAQGEIVFEGRRIDNLPAEAMRTLRGRQIGAVFQDPLTSLNPLLTVARQLVQTMTTHLDIAPAEARERALRLLTEVGIPAPRERLDSYPHELSGGMRQRVVLALAFCCEPRLVIADEPTTALDVSVQAQIIELFKRMCRERGTAVLLVTHDMGVIAETADRVAVMYAGRLVEIGPADAVLTAPAHPYTRGLMASIPTMRRRAEELTQIEGTMPRLVAIPSGCAFHPRCPDRLERCTRERPEMMAAGRTTAACWLASGNGAQANSEASRRA